MSMREYLVEERIKSECWELTKSVLDQVGFEVDDTLLEQFVGAALEQITEQLDVAYATLTMHPDNEDYVTVESAVTSLTGASIVGVTMSLIAGFLGSKIKMDSE